jgi:predicted enzyme related to lactoylglutathione lyase
MSALVIFSPDVRRLATFYERVLGAQPVAESGGDIRLVNDLDEILVHSIPEEVASGMVVTSPPVPRQNSPLKPVFEVGSLPSALQLVEAHGGVVTTRTFRIDDVTRHDVVDPDGNVIQLRSRFGGSR